MKDSMFGTIIGVALGLALVFGSFGDMLIVALFALIGYVVAKVMDGELDLNQYISGRRGNR